MLVEKNKLDCNLKTYEQFHNILNDNGDKSVKKKNQHIDAVSPGTKFNVLSLKQHPIDDKKVQKYFFHGVPLTLILPIAG